MRTLVAVGLVWSAVAALAPRVALPQSEAPATGFAIWVRTPGGTVQDLTASAFGVPPFTVGHRGSRVAFGAGVGVVRFNITDKNTFGAQTTTDKLTGTLFQIGPSALIDVWRSSDGRVRGNVALGASVGRLSITDRSEFVDFNGAVQRFEDKTTGTLLSVNAGVGGDYFLHRHFALGLEVGLRGTMALGIEAPPSTTSSSLGPTVHTVRFAR